MTAGLLVFLIGCSDNNANDNAQNENKNEVVENNITDSKSENNTDLKEQADVSVKEDVSNEDKSEAESKKEFYLNICDELENTLNNTLAEKKAGTTIDMREATETESKEWDALLNEIYGVFTKQLPQDEMEKVRVEETAWIENRDLAAKEAASEVEGGTMEPLVYETTIVEMTKERCYELVNNYMK